MKKLSLILLLFISSCTGEKRNADTADTTIRDRVDVSLPPDNTTTIGPDSVASNTTINCEGIGPVKLTDDMAALEKKAGMDNIAQDSLIAEGMFEGFVTRLWKDTQDEITVYWKEKKAPYKTIKMLEISNPMTPYRFKNGVTIGSGIKQLVKLNGGTAISLHGFGWDYGGTFSGFNKGKLADEMPCFGGVFALPEAANTSASSNNIMGDQLIRSDAETLQEFEINLVTLRISNQ